MLKNTLLRACLNFATEGISDSDRGIFLSGEGGVGVPTASEPDKKSTDREPERPRAANSKQALIISLAALLIGCAAPHEPKQYADYSGNSGFALENADSVSVENLEVLAKVWGFAKYHHPVFAGETHNADYELFELLPKVAYAEKDERNAVLLEWITDLGEFRSAEKRLRKEIADKRYTSPTDWGWLEDEALLGAELSEKLQELRWAKRKKQSRYAESPRFFLNIFSYPYISFDAESANGPFFSDTGYALLTLFRLWNMAEYYFPSVDIADKTWSDVLPDYIPKFVSAENADWITAELITELSDTHSVMSNNPVYHGVKLPVELGFVEGKLIVTDNRKFLAEGEEPVFELGDEIISIGDRTPEYFVERTRKYIAASNESALLRDAAGIARYINDTIVNVIVQRDGEEKEFFVSALSSNVGSEDRIDGRASSYEFLNDKIGYINPDKCDKSDQATIMETFADTKAIIVDMRCYPMEFGIPDFISDYYIPNKTDYVTWALPVVELPGYYQKKSAFVPMPHGFMEYFWLKWFSRNDDFYKGSVVILVNAYTQSMAECIVMAFQAAPNCVVVGSQTAGADGNTIILPLPLGIKTRFSGIGVTYPDGTNAQRAGIRIDHYVEPTIEGIRAGRDEVLEKALEIISRP